MASVKTERKLVFENPPLVVDKKIEPEVKVWTQCGGNLPQRNNNPLNITPGKSQEKYLKSGDAKISTSENGKKWMWYRTPQIGFTAAKQLLTSSYKHLTVGEALKKWGTGDKDTGFNHKVVNDLSESELSELINKMAIWEGYYDKRTGNNTRTCIEEATRGLHS